MHQIDTKYHSSKKRLLEKILEDIDNGTASVQDYQEYRDIVNQSGVDENKISDELKKHNIENLEQYHKQRLDAKTFEEQRKLNGLVAGVLVGIGMFVLYHLLKDE